MGRTESLSSSKLTKWERGHKECIEEGNYVIRCKIMFTGEKREQGEEGHEFLEMEKWGACGISERMSFKKLLSWIS